MHATRHSPLSRFRFTAWTALAILTLALSGPGCVHRAELRPAEGAREADALRDAAVSRIDDVRVTVQADAWPGDPEVALHVTPMKVRIANRGEVPVLLRYEDLAIVSEDGRRHAALPPYGVTGSVSDPVLATGHPTVPTPLFHATGFRIAGYYGPIYPGLDPWIGPFHYDPFYFDHYHRLWIEESLPTNTMVRWALPEGVLEPGGRVEGFVYFERVSPDRSRVRFRADLVNAETGREFGEISIPFRVDEAVAGRTEVETGGEAT